MSGAVAWSPDPVVAGQVEDRRAVLWRVIGRRLFRWSLHNAYRYRCALLRFFGAEVGAAVKIRSSVSIDCPWNMSFGRKSMIGDECVFWAERPLAVGDRSVISQYCVVSTWAVHGEPGRPTRCAEPIDIGDDVWIAAECYVGPGVAVANGVVVGSRSVVEPCPEPWSIYAGDPIRRLGEREYSGQKP